MRANQVLPFLIIMRAILLHPAWGAGELKILTLPKVIAPFMPMNILLTRTDVYKERDLERNAEIKELTELKVSVYNKWKNETLPQYKVEGQDKTFLKQAPGDLWQARYIGYFLDAPREAVTLKIEYKRTQLKDIPAGWIEVFTDPFIVKKELTISYFRPNSLEKDLNDKIEGFMRHAVDRCNRNMYGSLPFRPLLPGWKVQLKSYSYSTDGIDDIVRKYDTMKHDGNNLHPVASIIGFGSDVHAQHMVPQAVRDGYAVTSFRKAVSKTFKDQNKYSYFNRLELPEDVFLDNVFKYFQQQRWTSITIVGTTQDQFSGVNYMEYAKKYGIEFSQLRTDGSIKQGEELNLDAEFASISSSGKRIIVTTAEGWAAKNLLKQATKNKVTPRHGYQWIGLKNEKSLDFLDRNSEDWCIAKVNGNLRLCIEEFKGTIVFNSMYYHNFNSTESEGFWREYLYHDQFKSKTQRKYLTTSRDYASLGVDLALAYDVIKVNLQAISRLINARKPLYGKDLSTEIRNTEVTGMSSAIKFDQNGDRREFHGTIFTLWPIMDYVTVFNKESRSDWMNRVATDWHHAMVFENNGNKLVQKRVWSLAMINLFMKAANQHIYDFKGIHKCRIPDWYWDPSYNPIGGDSIPVYSFNQVPITFCKGKFRAEDQLMMVSNKQYVLKDYTGYSRFDTTADLIDFPAIIYGCTEKVEMVQTITPHFCRQGCGDIIDKSDVNTNSNGTCVRHGVCRCNIKAGYSGNDCRDVFCDGVKNSCPNGGTCLAPNRCKCAKGWKGQFCRTPVCTKCDSTGGACLAPENCECKPGYFGQEKGNTKACSKKCSCVRENAGNNGKCHPSTGHCITCKSGYFSPSSDCSHNLVVYFIVAVVVIVAVGILGVLLSKGYLNWVRLQRMLKNNEWILNWEDVKILDKAMSQKSSMMISAISMNDKVTGEKRKQFNVGTYDGMEVYYQKLEKDTIVLDKATREEVNAVRELKHANICIIIGCCIVHPNVAIITELQPKGSLEDIFGNDDIKLPWNFKFGLIKGIVAGLQFIQESPLKCHGRLKTSNVLVDNRWTVKLTGMGMKKFKSNTEASKNPNYGSLLWTAPELIRSQKLNNLDHLSLANVINDIYGFGVILSEFCTRDLPYSEVMLEKEDMINLITSTGDNTEARKIWDEFLTEHNLEMGGLVRPLIREHQWPKKYEIRKQLKALMEECWSDDPNNRPTLEIVKQKIDNMDPRKGELIEHLVSMLEQYSTNLEHIVTKRTAQLTKESQRTEDLVSRLLPKSVSKTLKEGGIVEPENFEFTTIYFSDIVGFTSIARASTPFEVVALLNNMYTLFDGISGKHDVYKVETIGDAYMIVSGLPTRNGDLHAGEICTTALELMCAIGSFVVPHMPDTKLKLRSGVHTGPVVAGCVGLKMPRYCLFGDSVNVASEMESGGCPSRIQISSATETILKRLGGYEVEYRDEIETTKGGLLGRYFLNGKDKFEGVMPQYDL